jgi:iron complex outermembrane receptor protein
MANLVFGLKDMASDIASWSSFSDTTIHSLGFMPKFTWDAPVADRANRLLLGVDAYLDALDVDRYPDVSHAGASSEAAIDRLTLGAYVRDELELGNSVSAALGGRVETARTEADVDSVAGDQVDESETQGVEAVDVSLLKRYGGASKVFAKVGTVYRYPFVDEQVSYIGFGTDDFYADLDPETGLSFDLGGAWAVSKDLVMDLTLFLLDMEDEISWNPVTYRNENLDQTRRQGAEAGANWQAASWVRLGGTFTFTDARFTEGPNDGQDVPLAPTYHSSGRLTLEPVKRTTLEAVVSHVGSSWLGGDYANEGPKLDDYVVTDAILRHTCANEALMFYFGVQNIFDVTYASLAYASLDTDAYYPEPGRVFKGGVRYQF